jgi:hypothetical protein
LIDKSKKYNMSQITSTTRNSEVKIGDTFESTKLCDGIYGWYENNEITEIKTTKTGRIKFSWKRDYVTLDGSRKPSFGGSNGAVVPHGYFLS